MLTNWLTAVRQRLAKASPSPWTLAKTIPYSAIHNASGGEATIKCWHEGDMELIYHAPTDLTYACQVIEAVQTTLIPALEHGLRSHANLWNQVVGQTLPPDADLARQVMQDALTTWHRVVWEGRDA